MKGNYVVSSVRLPPGLHGNVTEYAKKMGLSTNMVIIKCIERGINVTYELDKKLVELYRLAAENEIKSKGDTEKPWV